MWWWWPLRSLSCPIHLLPWEEKGRELLLYDWCKPVFNRKATCNVRLCAGVPGTWWDLASHSWDLGGTRAFKSTGYLLGSALRFLCVSTHLGFTIVLWDRVPLFPQSFLNRWGNRQREVSELAWGHTAKIKIPIQSQAPEFMVLTRHSAQQLPTHHTVRKSRLLIYDLTYLGQANAVSTQCLHYDLTVF